MRQGLLRVAAHGRDTRTEKVRERVTPMQALPFDGSGAASARLQQDWFLRVCRADRLCDRATPTKEVPLDAEHLETKEPGGLQGVMSLLEKPIGKRTLFGVEGDVPFG